MAEIWNVRVLGHSDLGGRGDGMHVALRGNFAFVGHMGETGTSILDVSDPGAARLVARIAASPDTHAHKVQIQGDIMLTNRERIPQRTGPHQAGLAMHDITDPTRPRQVGWWPCGGLGVHRMTWWEGRLAYVTAGDDAVEQQFLVILDLADPTRPLELGRYWLPGQHHDERRDWTDDMRVKLHHAIVRDGLAYCGWWDRGLVILDVRDPGAIRPIGGLNLGPDVVRAAHTFCPLPGRSVAVTTEERIAPGCDGVSPNARLVDIRDPTNVQVLATFPIPSGDYCDRGGRFGPHNVHEPKPGTLIDGSTVYMTYFNGGLRVFDVFDVTAPVEIAYFVPDPPRGQAATQLNDVTVSADGRIYITDRLAGGMHIVELTSGAAAARPRAAAHRAGPPVREATA